MTGPIMSHAAAGLLRALIARSGASRERFLLGRIQSKEWHSLTFTGERHTLTFQLTGPHAGAYADRLSHRLEDAEFSIPGIIVADIAVVARSPDFCRDGEEITIEALTIADC